MKCPCCLAEFEEDALFCPMCGRRLDRELLDVTDGIAALDPAADRENASDADDEFRNLAARLDTMENAAVPEEPAGYEPAQPADAFVPEPVVPPTPLTEQRPYGAASAFPGYPKPKAHIPFAQRLRDDDAEDFDDGYTEPPTPEEGRYRRTTAGKRIGSICLCILMAVMLLYTVMNVSLRLTLTQDRIREATSGEKLLRYHLMTDIGETTAVNYLRELIGGENLTQGGITDEVLKDTLRSGSIPVLAGSILSDYAAFFFSDREPTCLNADYIAGELEHFNEELSSAAGIPVSAFRTDVIAERISGGDLSFLSIDGEGGWFYRHYDVNPRLPATIASLPILIICSVIVLLCMVMIFVINSANLPAGLNFSGVILVMIGSFFMLTAIGCLVLTFIKEIWIFTDLLRSMALWTGIISAALLLTGVVMLIVASALRRRAKRTDGMTIL